MDDADFTTPEGLAIAVKAANALKVAMNSDIDKALLQMAAVQEQRKKFEKYKEKFSRTLSRQLNNLFIHYGNHKGEADKNVEGLILPQHSGVHKELYPYTELMHWMKVRLFYRELVMCRNLLIIGFIMDIAGHGQKNV